MSSTFRDRMAAKLTRPAPPSRPSARPSTLKTPPIRHDVLEGCCVEFADMQTVGNDREQMDALRFLACCSLLGCLADVFDIWWELLRYVTPRAREFIEVRRIAIGSMTAAEVAQVVISGKMRVSVPKEARKVADRDNRGRRDRSARRSDSRRRR